MVFNCNKMQPLLNPSKEWQTIPAGSLKVIFINIEVTAEKIIIYTHIIYSLSLKLWRKWKYNILFILSLYTAARLVTPTSLLICVQFIPQWEAIQIRWLWRRHEHQTKLREFIYEEVFTFDFNNFMCIISLYIIILKFIQIPWPDVHMNNLEECFFIVFFQTLLNCLRTPVS